MRGSSPGTSSLPDTLRQSALVQFLLVHAVAIGAPLCIILGSGPYAEDVQAVIQGIVAAAFAFTATLIIFEALMAAARRTGPPLRTSKRGPRMLSIVVVAYLPNEQAIIVDSVERLLTSLEHPRERLQVLLAYNTPEDLPVEAELRALAARQPCFELLRVEGSESKAQNLQAALRHVRGGVTAILDSDHHLQPDAPARAMRWIDNGYDAVQGRCVVRNGHGSILRRAVAIEFEQIYGLAHTGRSLLVDTAIFGGANGWWRTDVLRSLGFDRSMLTEDIDVTMRAMLAGHRVVHDRSVISTELAPASLGAWWRQRTRWAQGWLQVTMRHQRALLRSELPWPARAYWTVMLGWREAFPLISLQIVTLVAADLMIDGRMTIQFDPLLVGAIILTIASGLIAAVATWRLALPQVRHEQRAWRFALYGLLATPYTMLKNTVALVSLGREVLGDTRWVVTHRAAARAATVLAGLALAAPAILQADEARAQTASIPVPPERTQNRAPAPTDGGTASGQQTVSLVAEGEQPRTLGLADRRTGFDIALPGRWQSASARIRLNLRGADDLSPDSRYQVLVAGQAVASGQARPGTQTVTASIPRQQLTGPGIRVELATTLGTTLAQCPRIDDPSATLQLLPGSRIEFSPGGIDDAVLGDLPGVLVDALGSEPSEVRLRFDGDPTPDGIRAAGVAAGAIAAARGYPGVRVRFAQPDERATLLLRPTSSAPSLRIGVRSGRPTLVLSGSNLTQAALALSSGALADVQQQSMQAPPAPAIPPRSTPSVIPLPGASATGTGAASATTQFTLPARYAVQRGALARVTASINGPAGIEATSLVNARPIETVSVPRPGQAMQLEIPFAGRGPAFLRGDLRPGANGVTIRAVVPREEGCTTLPDVSVDIRDGGTLNGTFRARTAEDASLATWPYPADAQTSWQGTQVVLPAGPSADEVAAVVGVLAESRRIDDEPALPEVALGGEPDASRPALVVARQDAVPEALGSKVEGGVPQGTLAVVETGQGAAQVLAVGAGALRPLEGGVDQTQLVALVADVGAERAVVRVPDDRLDGSAAEAPTGRIRYPLLVLGLSLLGIALLSVRSAHRRRNAADRPA